MATLLLSSFLAAGAFFLAAVAAAAASGFDVNQFSVQYEYVLLARPAKARR